MEPAEESKDTICFGHLDFRNLSGEPFHKLWVGYIEDADAFDIRHEDTPVKDRGGTTSDSSSESEEEVWEVEMALWTYNWGTSLFLAECLLNDNFEGLKVLDLGAGLGITSCACAKAGGQVECTDYSPESVEFAKKGVEKNSLQSRVKNSVLDWNHISTTQAKDSVDLVIGSDVLYLPESPKQIKEAIKYVLGGSGCALFSDPKRSVATEFIDLCRKDESLEVMVWEVQGAASPYITIENLRFILVVQSEATQAPLQKKLEGLLNQYTTMVNCAKPVSEEDQQEGLKKFFVSSTPGTLSF